MLKFTKELLSGDILAKEWFKKQYRLVLLICGLLFVYIYFGYQSERQLQKLHLLKKTLQDAYFTEQTISAQMMSQTRQSSVAKMLEERGSKVTESHRSAIRIE